MEEEISKLENALSTPKKPVMAIVGSAKVSSKLLLLENLIGPMDKIVIGGGMANTFLAAKGYNIGQSLCEHDMQDTARSIMDNATKMDCEIILPIDIVVAKEFTANTNFEILPSNSCPNDLSLIHI